MISLCPGVEPGNVTAMAVAGVGLWVAVANSSNIQLYHTESFIHLQVIFFSVLVRNRLKSGGLELVLGHTKIMYSMYLMFSMNINIYNHNIKTILSPRLRHIGAKKLVSIL